ncbi:MAG: helix-turn-helix transcriptional regulator [Armatimonadetes bacterium]|nr:helix-turn-helix transcriptional regulator [Armatimonadota bacterium]
MRTGRPLSVLELTTLGIILKRGPCLGYVVLQNFAHSQTSAYRSGAGTVYPLLKRLTASGHLLLEENHYTLTDLGRNALRKWLASPTEGHGVGTLLDEVRSRVYFMRLLTPPEAVACAEGCLDKLRKLEVDCRRKVEDYAADGDPFSELAMLGALRETEARIKWMEEMVDRFRSGQPWQAGS